MPVPAEVQNERIEICRKCEHFNPTFGKCSKCGCIMFVKTRLIGARCPVQKWDAYRKP